MTVQVVVEVSSEETGDTLSNARTVRAKAVATQLDLGLAFKGGFLNAHRHRPDDTAAYVVDVVILLKEPAQRFHYGLFEIHFVGSAQSGMLAVDEGEIVFPVLVGMGEGDFDIVRFEVNDGIIGFGLQILRQQIEESVFGIIPFPVEGQGEAGVEIGVIPKEFLEVFLAEPVAAKNFRVGNKPGEGAVFFLAGSRSHVLPYQVAPLEFNPDGLAIPEGLGHEMGRQCVDCFRAHSVESDGLLEGFRIVFSPGIDFTDALPDLPEGNAAAIIPHGDLGIVQFDLDAFPVTHGKFVQGIVRHLLDKHIQPFVGGSALTGNVADIHAGAHADVLAPIEGFNRLFVVNGLGHFRKPPRGKKGLYGVGFWVWQGVGHQYWGNQGCWARNFWGRVRVNLTSTRNYSDPHSLD